MTKLNKQQFFTALAPTARFVRLQGSPILPSVRIAYSYYKSKGILVAWHNLTEIEVGKGQLTPYWHGDYIVNKTMECKKRQDELTEQHAQEQRVYPTLYHSFLDEDNYYEYKQSRLITQSNSPEIQLKGLIKRRQEPLKLVEQLSDFIKLYQLEHYDRIDTFFDKPNYVEANNIVPVMYQDEFVAIAFLIDNLIYISLRKIEEYFTINVEERNGILRINGRIVNSFTIDNLCYVNIEEVKLILLFHVEWDQYAKVLSLY